MTLIKWKPTANAFPSNFSSYVDSFFNDEFFRTPGATTQPSVNIVENENGYRLEVAAPGFSKEEFSINVDHNVLTIAAEKKTEQKEEKENFTRREFSYASFKRSFTLPETIEAENIGAAYENGILNVSLPKKTEAKKETKKTISVA
jgi:HSP20 family protein